MKRVLRVGLLVFIASLFTVGTVSAVSEWAVGDTVQLVVTTTNMGDVDVIKSTGTITIRDPRGIMYQCGDFDVEGVVHPGEAVNIPVSWNTGMALLNASWVPGNYDIILDGELAYANGEYETTHSEVNAAFSLYVRSLMLREMPEIDCQAGITGVTQISDTYYPGSTFMAIIWIDNDGNSLFIPEIQLSFSCEGGYTFEPESECYYQDECEIGLNQYLVQCQLPDDMPEGTCTYDVDLSMHYIEVDVTDDNYEDGYAGFWHDYFVLSEVGSEPGDDWYQLSINVEPLSTTQPKGVVQSFYAQGDYVYQSGDWPSSDLGLAYCFQNLLWNDVEQTPDEEVTKFCGESGYNRSQYRSYDVSDTMASNENYAHWQWTATLSDEGYHNVEVEIRERTATDVGASDLVAVFVDRVLSRDDPNQLYVWITNEGDYAFQPEFSIGVLDLDATPLVTVEDLETPIAPVGTSLHSLLVDVGDIPLSEEGYVFTLSVEPVEIFDMQAPEDLADIPLDIYYRFYTDSPKECTTEEWMCIQDDFIDAWNWEAFDGEWTSAGIHTVMVEVTDDVNNPDYNGVGDRVGVANLDVTISDDDTSGDDGTTGGDDSGSSTGDTGTGSTDTGTPTGSEEDTGSGNDTGGDIGDIIQSIINQIMDILRRLLG